MKIKINLSTIFGKILQYKISWKFIQCFSHCYMHTHTRTQLPQQVLHRGNNMLENEWQVNTLGTRYLNCLYAYKRKSASPVLNVLRNKYTVINHLLGKLQSHKMFPITWWHTQMCVLMSLMSLEKQILLLTLLSFTAPQILYNFRYIQNHKKHLLPSPCLFSHSAGLLCIHISSAPTGQTSVIFNTGDFDENLSRKSKFG
jgi:hypothetical protein